ncbi:MAG: DUF655 domain-containing protein [Candidatus Hodarchaeales archaeon]|jgi:putative nucleotide binding protein
MKKRSHQTQRHEKRKQIKQLEFTGVSYILDFYPQGKSLSRRRSNDYNPLAVVVTANYFEFYDVILSFGSEFSPQHQLIIKSNDKRILKLNKMNFDQLSSSALDILPSVIKSIVGTFETRYIKFLNQAHPLTTQMHQLRLLPGVGQKRMWTILEARKKAPFTSFSDFSERTGISDPISLFSGRILSEIDTSPKYCLFTKKRLD